METLVGAWWFWLAVVSTVILVAMALWFFRGDDTSQKVRDLRELMSRGKANYDREEAKSLICRLLRAPRELTKVRRTKRGNRLSSRAFVPLNVRRDTRASEVKPKKRERRMDKIYDKWWFWLGIGVTIFAVALLIWFILWRDKPSERLRRLLVKNKRPGGLTKDQIKDVKSLICFLRSVPLSERDAETLKCAEKAFQVDCYRKNPIV
jgi:hypothetical protein